MKSLLGLLFTNFTFRTTLLSGWVYLGVLLPLILTSGCSTYSKPGPIKPVPLKPAPRSDDYRHKVEKIAFKTVQIDTKVQRQKLQQKIDILFILVDESQSMDRLIRGQSRQDYLKQILQYFENTIPANLSFRQRLVMFGEAKKQNIHTLNSLAAALKSVGKTIHQSNQRAAILILSEWQKINHSNQNAAEHLFLNSTISPCIHMLGIGNIHPDRRLLKVNRCGSAINANQLTSPNKMADFVEKLFFSGPTDSDEDGIFDYQDNCPNTSNGTPIDWHGCPRDSRYSNPRYIIHDNHHSKTENENAYGGQ